MIILGIDPGTARVGWGVIETKSRGAAAKAYGCIMTDKSAADAARLSVIFHETSRLLAKFKPQSLSLEAIFFSKNAKTAIGVGQARGVIMLAAHEHGVPVVSYTPNEVKLAICGYGNAEKLQVQKMVAKLLRLPAIPQPDDTADALAIALTHMYSHKEWKK